jgi:kojibiose phosphorylase
VRIFVDGSELQLERGEILEHRRVLDMRQGIVWREWRHRDPAGRVTMIRGLRLASLADRHLLFQSITVTPENYSGRLRLETIIPEQGTEHARPPRGEAISVKRRQSATAPAILVRRTVASSVTVAMALLSRLRAEGSGVIPPVEPAREGGYSERWEWEAELGRTYRLDRFASVYTSHDGEHPAAMAGRHAADALHQGAEKIVAAHVRAWESAWQTADVAVVGDANAQRALRFACYHLISVANPDEGRTSIGARMLTGLAYRGHIFWDTEIFLLPFYAFTHPEVARSQLLYRYRTLPMAREKARAMGYRGALYPWESADTGAEATPPYAVEPTGDVIPILTGEQEHHISADIAYAVWQYWQISGDDRFLLEAGAEIIIETARFWASRGRFEADGRYHIRTVIGPDEYHEGVDDNAYTNVMAQWNLERGVEVARLLAERWPQHWRELAMRLNVTAEELDQWSRIARAMYTGFDPETGLFEQFQGYFDLEEIDLAAYEPRTVPMDVLLGRERTQRSKVVKQADVVLLIALLWDRFSPLVREANFRYYEPRCGHGSSLSPAVHALVAARLGDITLAERYFRQTMAIDLSNILGNAAGGVHAAALGGLWQATVFGFAGICYSSGRLSIDPHLPRRWRRLTVPLRCRDQTVQVVLEREPASIEIRTTGKGALTVLIPGGPETEITSEGQYMTGWTGDRWGPWERKAISADDALTNG